MLQDKDDDDELTCNVNGQRSNNEDHESTNKCFNILPSIFRKQYFKYKTNFRKKHYSFGMLNEENPSIQFPITEKCLIPGSPISPRVKNFNLDMKILVLSRNDNPYLSKQIQRSNSLTSTECDQEYFVEPATPIFSRRGGHCNRGSFLISNRHLYNDVQFDPENQKNLHEQLVRSPPPHFPETLSHFLFNESLISDQIDFDRCN